MTSLYKNWISLCWQSKKKWFSLKWLNKNTHTDVPVHMIPPFSKPLPRFWPRAHCLERIYCRGYMSSMCCLPTLKECVWSTPDYTLNLFASISFFETLFFACAPPYGNNYSFCIVVKVVTGLHTLSSYCEITWGILACLWTCVDIKEIHWKHNASFSCIYFNKVFHVNRVGHKKIMLK